MLAELRLRQGRSDEAARLLTGLEDERAALAPLVTLHVQRGERALAAALLGRYGDDERDATVLGAARARSRWPTARWRRRRGATERLRALAGALERDDLRAEAALLAGRVAAARGDAPAAGELEEAARTFGELRFPLEAARARLCLARSPRAGGVAARARGGPRRARRLRGASVRAAMPTRRRRSCASSAPSGRSAVRGDGAELTAREREVLRCSARA